MAIRKFTTTTTGPVNEPPVAVLATQKIDALIGHIIQLDGRQSYDPEKQPLTWKWRFVQVPIGSEVVAAGFKDIRPRSTAVSFIPDKTGYYVVELVVNDGELDSAPVTVTVNIQYSRVPIGDNIVPDAKFLWDYISNFWNLVTDREIITSVWSGAMQVIGSELIKLWGADLNKAIGTAQGTFQRRWQGIPTVTSLYSELDQRIIVGKTDSGIGGATGKLGETPGVGNTQVFYIERGEVGDISKTDFTNLEGNYGPKGRILVVNGEGGTIQRVATEFLVVTSGTDLSASGDNVVSLGSTFISDGVKVGDRVKILSGVDTGEYVVDVLVSETSLDLIRLDGSTPSFSSTGSTFEAGRYYSLAITDEAAFPEGQINVPWRVPHLLHVPSVNLEDVGVRPGDVLVLEVMRRDTGQSAELRTQVVGVDRYRLGFEFTLGDLVDGDANISRDLMRQLVLDLNIVTPDASDAEIDATAETLISFIPLGINLFTRPFSPYRITVKAKKIIHNRMVVVDTALISIPALQESPKDPPVVLRENLDYIVEDGAVVFVNTLFTPENPAPEQLWAECSIYSNNEVIEGNFGKLVDLGRDDLTAKKTRAPYLSAVRGLMFAYTNGPTVSNVRLGLQILLGLPFAEERGVILDIQDNFSFATDGSRVGRILVEDVDEYNRRSGIRRVYYYPMAVGVETNPATSSLYKENDIVEQFAPLSKGVDVYDYIKNPMWWVNTFAGLEILKYFRFKAIVDSDVFDSNDVAFAIEFVRTIRPYYTDVISTVLSELSDDIEMEEVLAGSVAANLYDNNWGLEACNRTSDNNHQGVVLLHSDGHPFRTRLTKILRDVTTYKYVPDSSVRVYSETGWDPALIRGRLVESIFTVEGDIFVILGGQPGATGSDPGLYEIASVLDSNTLILRNYAPAADPSSYYVGTLDADLFDYGTNLLCTIIRRNTNPITYGDDLYITDGNLGSSATANFSRNGVCIGDHLVDMYNEQEYRIDALTPLPTPPSPPFITDTQVRLKNLDGSPVNINIDADPFYVYRPDMSPGLIKKVLRGYGVYGSILRTEDNEINCLAFAPSMVGMMVNVSESGNPVNDGEMMITSIVSPNLAATDSPSTTGEFDYVSKVRFGVRPAEFERMLDFAPYGISEFCLKGDPIIANNYLVPVGPFQWGVDPGYTPQGTPADPYTLEGPADDSSNPVKLGFKKGDKIKILNGDEYVGPYHNTGINTGREFTIVDPSTMTVLEQLTWSDSDRYLFRVIRRMSI